MTRGAMARATALALGVLTTGILNSCGDEPNSPVGGPGGVLLVLRPSASALLAPNDQACARTSSAHVTVSGPSGVVVDTTVAVASCDGPITVAVPLATATGTLQIAIEETGQGKRLFTAAGSASLRRGERSETTLTLVPVVGGISVPASLPTLTAIGDSVIPTAKALFATGDTVTSAGAATWTADGSGVVRVSAGGAIVALKEGQATLTASLQGFSATTTVRVQAVVSAVSVSPDSVSMLIGSTTTLTAVAKDRNGNVLQRTPSWQSSNTAVATVDAGGVVRAVAPGQAVVTATSEGRSASSRIFVLQPVVAVAPTQLAFSAYQGGPNPADQTVAVTNSGSGALTGLSAAVSYTAGATGWLTATLGSTTAPSTLTVHASTGGLSAGTYQATITVTSTVPGAGTGRVTVQLTVGPPPVATVTVSPASVTVLDGGTTQLTATLKDAAGNVLSGRTVVWTTSNAQVATVSTTGLVTGVNPGSATITATSEGKSGTSSVTVAQPTLSATPTQLAFSASQGGASPASQTVAVTNGGSGSLTGLSYSVAYTIGTSGWLSASLDATTAPATLTVTATTGSLVSGTYQAVITLSSTVPGSGTAQVNVTFTVGPPPVARVSVTPGSATLLPKWTTQLSAAAYDASGAVLTDQVITFSSDNTAAATVSPTGLVTGIAGGTAVITASSGGQSATAIIRVAQVAASPTSITFAQTTAPDTVSIYNSGSGTLNGLYIASVTYGDTLSGNWLNFSLSPQTAPANLILSPNIVYNLGVITATVRVCSTLGIFRTALPPSCVSITVSYTTFFLGLLGPPTDRTGLRVESLAMKEAPFVASGSDEFDLMRFGS